MRREPESHKHLAFAMEVLGDGLWVWDVPGNTIDFAPRWKEMLGYAVDEVGSAPDEFTSRLHPDEKDEVVETVARHLRGETAMYAAEHRLRCKDGSWIWVLCRGRILARNADDQALYFIGTSSDITQRKHNEQALAEERQRLAHLLDGTGTWAWEIQTGEVVINEAWAECIGYTVAELAPINIQTLREYTHPDDRPRYGEILKRHFAGELPYYDCACRLRHKDGRWIWVHDRGRVTSRSTNGLPLLMIGTHLDITARKLAETEFHTQLGQREGPLPSLDAVTDAIIQAAVERSQGNLTHAAQLIGMSRSGLAKRLAKRVSLG